MERLLPHPGGPTTIEESYVRHVGRGGVSGGGVGGSSERPWVQACMVSSIDGSATLRERSAGLAGPSDLQVLLHARRIADAIFVGAGTVRIEGYQPTDRPMFVVSQNASLDWSSPLWLGDVTLVTHDAAEVPSSVRVIRAGQRTVDLATAVAATGVEVLQCEGGPHLLGAMLDADLVDEWFLTIGAQTVGGSGLRVALHPDETPHRWDLAHLLHEDHDLYARYVRRRQVG
jgi:riboflavin biosynthesis pyrimidine reductase